MIAEDEEASKDIEEEKDQPEIIEGSEVTKETDPGDKKISKKEEHELQFA